jgi:hypothetical protein
MQKSYECEIATHIGPESLMGFLLPQYEDMVSNVALPALLREMAFMLWLVIEGAKPQPPDAATSSSSAG